MSRKIFCSEQAPHLRGLHGLRCTSRGFWSRDDHRVQTPTPDSEAPGQLERLLPDPASAVPLRPPNWVDGTRSAPCLGLHSGMLVAGFWYASLSWDFMRDGWRFRGPPGLHPIARRAWKKARAVGAWKSPLRTTAYRPVRPAGFTSGANQAR